MLRNKGAGRLGLVYSLLMGLSFGMMGYLVGRCALPAAELVFLRASFSCLCLTPFVYRQIAELFSRTALTLWLRSIAGSFAMICFFWNLQKAGVGTATALANFAPVLVTLISWSLLKERLGRVELLGISITVAGALTLYKLGASITNQVILVGFLGAFSTAIAQLALKQAAQIFSPTLVVWCMSLITSLTSLIISGTGWQVPGEWVVVTGVALMGLLGQVFMTLAYMKLSAPVASTFGLSSLVWGVVLEVMLLGRQPTPGEWGSYLAIIGGICVIHLSHRAEVSIV